MENIVRRPLFYGFFSFFLFLAVFPVYAGGGQDRDLAKADELIRNKQHDEAILVLTDFSRRHPDKFDLAQQRLRRIYKIRDDFNRIADELIHTLVEDPGNDERVYELSTQLYALEHEDSPLLANFVARAREIALFNIYRTRLRSILERGRLLLERDEYLAALQTYAEGMTIMREEFFLSGYGAAIENEVRRESENINSMIASFQQVSTQMGTIAAELSRAVSAGETARIPEITNRLTAAMDRFIAAKHALDATAASFERNLNNIRTLYPDTGDRNHLAFVTVVINGRTGETIQEGMQGAFYNYWRTTIGTLVSNISRHVQNANASAVSSLDSRNYRAVQTSLVNMDYYIGLTPHYFEKHRQLSNNRQQTSSLFNSVILDSDINQFIEIRALGEANGFLSQASNLASAQNIDRTFLSRWQDGRIDVVQAINGERATRNTVMGLQRSISTIVERANQVHVDILRYGNTMHVFNAARAIEGLQFIYLAEEQESAQRFYTIAHSGLAENLAARKVQLDIGRNYLNGERHTTPEGVETTYFYPTEALAELTGMIALITTDLAEGNAILDQYRNEPQTITSIPGISASRVNQQNTVNELNEVRAQGLALLENARNRSTQAQAHRQEGERLFREAQAAFQRRDYDTADDLIDRADRRFGDSLALQESASLHQMRDNQLIALSAAISAAKNESILAEVRGLINTARDEYFRGNFQQADERIVRAANRWRITSSTPNEEIVYWTTLIRTALAGTSGRVIPPTAPLFPEMSQLLSQAQRNFEEGVRLINAGQRAQGIVRFNETRDLTREVRLMYPLNQEAGILDLRIEQFLDRAAFNAAFEQRIRNSQNLIRQRRSMEAFADLLNLAEINPAYPNIRNIVTQAEIDMGFRPPPPNPADVAQSRELTASARRILESNNAAQYQTALIQLDQAIRLNPQNQEAPNIRDQLVRRTNQPSGNVLSSQDEAAYQQALRELQANNNLVALAIVERLLQNPQNRNVTKLVELQQRIRMVL